MITWYYLVLGSSIVMGLSTLLEKKILKGEHATSYSASFSLLVAVLSLSTLYFAKFNANLLEILEIYGLSLLSSLTYLFTARVYKHGSISVATPILSSIPQIFVVILAFIFLDEKLSLIQYIAIASLVALTYLLVFSKKNVKNKPFENKKYLYLLILTTFLMAVGGVLMKHLLNLGVNLFEMFILLQFFIAANMAVYLSFRYGGIKEEVLNIKNNFIPIFSIAVLTLTYRLFYYASLQVAFVSIASPLRNSISLIITVVIGGLLFKEGLIKRKLAISMLIVIAVYAIITL